MKIGDRVKIMDTDDYPKSLREQSGTIVFIEDDGAIWVIPDVPVSESGAKDSRWLFDPAYLRKEEP